MVFFFLIYFPTSSLLVYRKAADFYALILYLVTKSFLMEWLGSFKYSIMFSANWDDLTSSFPTYTPFTSFLYYSS